MKNAKVIVKGLPASPGAATGPVVFFAEDAEKMLKEKTNVRFWSASKLRPKT